MNVILTACHILFMEIFCIVIKLTWFKCPLLMMCVQCKLCNYAHLYVYISTTMGFHAGNLQCFSTEEAF